MKIATARTKTSKRWRTCEISWEAFLDSLRTPMRTAETMREYKAMAKSERDRVKESAGGFVGGALTCGQRKTEFVKERWMITLDADDAVPKQWEKVVALLDFRMCCYPTHSSTEDQPRLRWVIPTDRAMTPDEYPAVSRLVASWIGIETVDPTTHDLARLFFYPSVPKDAPYELREQDGPLLSVDEVLATYGDNDAWRDTTLWPIAKKESEVRVRNVQKAGDPLEKPGIVGLFCRTYDVEDAIAEFIPEVYTPCEHNGRYTYAGGSTFGGAIVYDDGRFLYSNHATDPCCGMSVNAFDLVRIHKFGQLDADAGERTAVTNLPSYKEMVRWASGLDEVAKLQVAEGIARASDDFSDLLEGDEPADIHDPDWETKLARDPKTGVVRETRTNAKLYIRNLPEFKDKLGYNPMTDSITVCGDLPWRKRRRAVHKARAGVKKVSKFDDIFGDGTEWEGNRGAEKEWQETDWPDFYAHMEQYGFDTGRNKVNGMLDGALLSVALERTYHPIKDPLKDLEWDGVERLDTMFIRWLGAEDNELNRVITRRWMIAAVDRIVRPGCQFDQILITCGPQGLGKTKMLRLLSRGFYTCSIDDPSMSKGTAEKLKGVWIVEFGELDKVRKADQNTLKNFITATEDRYRSAYARDAKTYKRQCVFAGTSNNGAFLRDDTGERRYWVMPVKGIGDRGELRGFEDEVDQLWAEAAVRWKERMHEFREPGQTQDQVNLYLYLKENHLEAEMQKRREMYKLPDNDRVDVLGYLEMLRPANWYDMPAYERRNFARGDWLGDYETCTLRLDKVCIKELKYELFDGRSDKDLRLGDILDSADGWKKGPKGRNKAYASWSMPMWVRIGSEADTGKDEE